MEKEQNSTSLQNLLKDYQRLTKKSNVSKGMFDEGADKGRGWIRISFNEKYAGGENKEYDTLAFYKDGSFSYLWNSSTEIVWLRKNELLNRTNNVIFDTNNIYSRIPAEIHQALEKSWQQQQIEQNYPKLKEENEQQKKLSLIYSSNYN